MQRGPPPLTRLPVLRGSARLLSASLVAVQPFDFCNNEAPRQDFHTYLRHGVNTEEGSFPKSP